MYIKSPALDVLSGDPELPSSWTNSVMSCVQNDALLLHYSVLAWNRLLVRWLIGSQLDALLGDWMRRLGIAAFQGTLSGPPHKSLRNGLPLT